MFGLEDCLRSLGNVTSYRIQCVVEMELLVLKLLLNLHVFVSLCTDTKFSRLKRSNCWSDFNSIQFVPFGNRDLPA